MVTKRRTLAEIDAAERAARAAEISNLIGDDDPVNPLEMSPKDLRFAAAQRAGEASVSLLQFARTGGTAADEAEPLRLLLCAAQLAIEAMGEDGGEHSSIYADIRHTLRYWDA